MSGFLLFLKRSLRSPQILAAMAVMLLISSLSFGYTQLREDLPCAVCTEDDSEEAYAILSDLEESGFVICDSRKEVEAAVRGGTADCGAILLDGLQERMESGEMEGCTDFIVSDATCLDSSYALLLCSAIFRAETPYLTQRLFASGDVEVSKEEVEAYLAQAMEELTPLTFVITDVEGTVIESVPSDQLPVGLIAIASLLCCGFPAVSLRQSARPVQIRFTSRRAFAGQILLPRLLPPVLLMLGATAAGLVIGQHFLAFSLPELLLGCLGYDAVLSLLLTVLMLLPLPDHALICLLSLDAAVSLVLCPIYQNIALLVPWTRFLRIFSVPYLLYLLRDHSAAALGITLTVTAILLLLARPTDPFRATWATPGPRTDRRDGADSSS